MASMDSLRQFKSEIFRALAHPTRIAMLDELRDGELTVSDFVNRLKLEQSNLSQHLALMRARQIVIGRKSGSQVFYSVRDPLIFDLLDLMRQYFENQVNVAVTLLERSGAAPMRKRR
jgi:DNA-binding transcriptional ArsR family regulator